MNKYAFLLLISLAPACSVARGTASSAGAVVAASGGSHSQAHAFASRAGTMPGYFEGLKSDYITESDGVFTAEHKWVGKVRVKEIVGNKVYIDGGQWYYLKSFKKKAR